MSIIYSVLLFIVLVILFIISYTIDDVNLRICYWMVIVLLGLTIFNVILSIKYYIKLRNERGIRGPRGAPGERGMKGPRGVCATTEKCSIDDCRGKIMDIVTANFPEIDAQCLDNLRECQSPDQREKAEPLVKFVNELTKKCQKTQLPASEFFRKVRPQLELLKSNGETA